MKEYIDWTVFLGMNHRDEKTRIRCKNFFAHRLKDEKEINMSLENVGKCDDIIWDYNYTLQEVYYPFMDVLHSKARINRLPYSLKHYELAKEMDLDDNISFSDCMSMAMGKDGMLYTLNPFLLNMELSHVALPGKEKEILFPKKLELLYQRSLVLLVDW